MQWTCCHSIHSGHICVFCSLFVCLFVCSQWMALTDQTLDLEDVQTNSTSHLRYVCMYVCYL